LDKVAHLSKEDILKLNPNDLNSFDRPIAFKNPANFASAEKNSDLFLNLSLVSPALLMLDKNIRKDWVDLLSMYMMSMLWIMLCILVQHILFVDRDR
jgi:hypothetical protein